MPSRHFITAFIFIFSSATYAQLTEVASDTTPTLTTTEDKAKVDSAPPSTSVTPAPAPATDLKVEALQKQIDEMQMQLRTLAQPKQESPPPTTKPALLLVNTPSGQVPPASSSPVTTPLSLPTTDQLRKRDISLGWSYTHVYQKSEAKMGGSSNSDEQTVTRMKIEFSKNLSKFEFGAMLSANREEYGGADATMTTLGALARLNFIENRPGNDFIPYVVGYLGVIGSSFNSGSSSSDYEISGGGSGLGLGFNWFPFSQIFALNTELIFASGKMDNNASPKLEVQLKETTLSLGWKIYF